MNGALVCARPRIRNQQVLLYVLFCVPFFRMCVWLSVRPGIEVCVFDLCARFVEALVIVIKLGGRAAYICGVGSAFLQVGIHLLSFTLFPFLITPWKNHAIAFRPRVYGSCKKTMPGRNKPYWDL